MKFSVKEMKEIISDIELAENETINVHHCKEGNNNDRLYITNKGDYTVFYCHHCHKRGSIRNHLSALKRHSSRNKVSSLPSGYKMPYDASADQSKWPIPARMWLANAKINSLVSSKYQISYSKKLNRVLMPVYLHGEYQGYIARKLEGEGPKYLVRCKDRNSFIYLLDSELNNSIVIVEDVLSCIRISELGFNCLALQGTNIKDEVGAILSKFSSFSLWLDNDNPEVKKQQVKLINELKLFGDVKLIKTELDPKEYSNSELLEILDA